MISNQQSASRLDVAQLVQSISGTAQQTMTITPPAGQFVYLCSLEVDSASPTAPAASALIHTTTGLGGLKLYGGLTAVGGVVDKAGFYPAVPLKSATAGAACTIVSNAAITNVTYNVTATYYFAP